MRVNAAYDVGHRRQHQHIASAESRLRIRQDERLRFHATRIPDDRNDRGTGNALGRNRSLRQLHLTWIPPDSRIIRGPGQPRLHGRLRRGGLGDAKKKRDDQQKKMARLHLSTPKESWDMLTFGSRPSSDHVPGACRRLTNRTTPADGSACLAPQYDLAARTTTWPPVTPRRDYARYYWLCKLLVIRSTDDADWANLCRDN